MYEAEAGCISIALLGDISPTRRLAVFREERFLKLQALLNGVDAVFSSLEGSVHKYLDGPHAQRPSRLGGTYATVGGETSRVLQALLFGWSMRLTTGKRIVLVMLKQNEHLAYLSERFEAGQLVPVIDGPYKLSDARDAFRHFAAAKHKGKMVITMV